MTDADWRKDIDQLEQIIRETHPDPFVAVSEADFDAAVDSLKQQVPGLSPPEIFIGMEALVGMLNDGHSGMVSTFTYPTVDDAEPRSAPRPELSLSSLPVKFNSFADGVFITAGTTQYADHIGKKLVSVNGVSVQEAISKINDATHYDNEYSATSIAMSYLTSPSAHAGLGFGAAGKTLLVLETSDGNTQSVELEPLGVGPVAWQGYDFRNNTGANDDLKCGPERQYCQFYLAKKNIVYVRIDAIANNDDYPLATFMREAKDLAERRNSRIVIDLRDNPGGTGDYNRSILHAILQSAELNQYGRSFVLISRRTFSAAQLLVSSLEFHARVIFVGQPTGARPTHFGDAEMFRLEKSSLGVRISTVKHSSPIPIDRRQSTSPHYAAPFSASDHFTGRDPALEFINAAPREIAVMDLAEHSLREGGGFAFYYILIKELGAPDAKKHYYADDVLRLAEALVAEGDADAASMALQIASFVYRNDNRFGEALARLQ
jgi:hypothetical protein